jgi:16S rRNA (guanine527-N7)-methyltransferase
VSTTDFQRRLIEGLTRAGSAPGAELVSQLEAYHRLLQTWGRRINLTGLDLTETTPEVLERLFMEPVLAARFVHPGAVSLLDIGSGGGSPAVPLAAAIPGSRLTMVESRAKKSVFLTEVCRGLGQAGQWRVITSRFEDLVRDESLRESMDLVSIRAVRVDAPTLATLGSFVRPGGQLFLFQSTGTAADPLTGFEETGVHALVEARKSELRILEKRRVD